MDQTTAPPAAVSEPSQTPTPSTAGSGGTAAGPSPTPSGASSSSPASGRTGSAAASGRRGAGEAGVATQSSQGGGETTVEPAAPATANDDPQFQTVTSNVRRVARGQRAHPPAAQSAGAAQSAARNPRNAVTSEASADQVSAMNREEPRPFDRRAFKAALLEKIRAAAPKNLDEADKFQENGKLDEVRGGVTSQVAAGKEQAQGGIAQRTAERPNTSGITPRPVTALTPTAAGSRPGDVGAGSAVPPVRSDASVSLQAGPQAVDQKMTQAGVNDEQLRNANEPSFGAAANARQTAQTHADQAPGTYRQQEEEQLAASRTEAQSGAAGQLGAMFTGRRGMLSQVAGLQGGTKSEDEQKRAAVATHIESIYQQTKRDVESRLGRLDTEVTQAFDRGARIAQLSFEVYVNVQMENYKNRRYGGISGPALWLKDLFFDLPDEVNTFYETGREQFIVDMDKVIDKIATLVETSLTEAKDIISSGKKKIQDYVTGLPASLQQVGREASASIQSKFDALEEQVNEKQNQLIETLAAKYNETMKKLDSRIEEMKEANKGLVSKAMDAVGGVIQTIIELKNMLLGVLSRAADVITTIINAPIKFLGNLVSGVKLGLKNFVSNIGTHLKQGLMGWLFGTLAAAGIELPTSFDVKGILSLVLQVLGLTYTNIRGRAVRILGEPFVSRMEQVAEIFKILVTEGPGGLWNHIKEQLGNLKETLLGEIKSWVITRVITAGIMWLLSMLNPASAFIKACKAIYDIIMFFVERGSQILALVNAIIDSLAAIAAGTLTAAANKVEQALARVLPVAISFLASLLGLGGISEKIKKIIKKLQEPVNKAIDWVINKAAKLVRSAAQKLGGRKKDKVSDTNDPKHDLKVQAGLAEIDKREKPFEKEGGIDKENAKKITKAVKSKHRVFKKLEVVDGKDSWDYEYAASPKGKKSGPKKSKKGDQDGSEKHPYLITWYKRPLSKYKPFLLSDKVERKKLTQATLKKKQSDGEATLYSPAGSKKLPFDSESLGVATKFRVKKNMVVNTKNQTHSRSVLGKFKRRLKKYGYDRETAPDAHTDGDHVVELQVSGTDSFDNLWPLNESENRSSGSQLGKQDIDIGNSKTKKLSELKNKYFKIDKFKY
jgi:hypothetical protein